RARGCPGRAGWSARAPRGAPAPTPRPRTRPASGTRPGAGCPRAAAAKRRPGRRRLGLARAQAAFPAQQGVEPRLDLLRLLEGGVVAVRRREGAVDGV